MIFGVFSFFSFFQHLRLSFVVFTNKEISVSFLISGEVYCDELVSTVLTLCVCLCARLYHYFSCSFLLFFISAFSFTSFSFMLVVRRLFVCCVCL